PLYSAFPSCYLSPRSLPPPSSTLFPYTTLFRSSGGLIASGPWVGGPAGAYLLVAAGSEREALEMLDPDPFRAAGVIKERSVQGRSEEHTSELQSRFDLVCRLLLEKKKKASEEV